MSMALGLTALAPAAPARSSGQKPHRFAVALLGALALGAAGWLPPLAQAQETSPGSAQERASMVADSVSINGDDTLTAQGNVEVFYQGRHLTASQLVYNRATDQIDIQGPLILTDATGKTIVLADQAAMDADLANGVMTGARMVLDRELQIASAQMIRVGGRYTQLSRSVASSCKICTDGSTPIWEIRSRKTVHDDLMQQIHFTNAQIRIAGVPVFWVPRLRIPDPSVERANGFLRPIFQTTSGLGAGLKMPYFITLGESADLTLIPYLTTKNGRTLGYRYRQAFTNGYLEFNGAASRDDIKTDESRGYLNLDGHFSLPQGFNLRLHGRERPAGKYGADRPDKTERIYFRTADRRTIDPRGRIQRHHPHGHRRFPIPSPLFRGAFGWRGRSAFFDPHPESQLGRGARPRR
jgi:LPS-assembly protein